MSVVLSSVHIESCAEQHRTATRDMMHRLR